MNIFVLSLDPIEAAQAQCDKHIVKMVVESTQMLSTVLSECTDVTPPCKPTHKNHPCNVWARTTHENWQWLLEHAIALLIEYSFRYGKHHALENALRFLAKHEPGLPHRSLTPFAQAMPDTYKRSDPVAAYRAYYIGDKARFARWNNGRPPPEWWPNL